MRATAHRPDAFKVTLRVDNYPWEGPWDSHLSVIITTAGMKLRFSDAMARSMSDQGIDHRNAGCYIVFDPQHLVCEEPIIRFYFEILTLV